MGANEEREHVWLARANAEHFITLVGVIYDLNTELLMDGLISIL